MLKLPFNGHEPNQQPVERVDRGNGLVLDVHSVFHTIQGEGPFSGRAATFIRLAGCNLQCPLCDTEYTRGRYDAEIGGLVQQCRENNRLREGAVPLVVITGGEPFRQPLGPLLRLLCVEGFAVQVESNGTLAPPLAPWSGLGLGRLEAGRCYLVVSPKVAKVNAEARHWAAAFKYVLKFGDIDVTDGLPVKALMHKVSGRVGRPRSGVPVYVQPADEQDDLSNQRNMNACAAVAQEFGYTLQLQIHKYLGVE